MTRFRTADVDGLELFFREAGPEDAPTLVLLPGFPSSSAQFQPLMDRLADRFHLIAVDYPGFGRSQTPASDAFEYTFDALSTYTERLLLDVLGLDSFWMYLFDFGAPVGLRIAARRPDVIAGLVVQNANAYEAGLGDLMGPVVAFNADRAGLEGDIRGLLTLEVTRMQYEAGAGDPARINPDGPLLDQALIDGEPHRKDAFTDLLFDYANNVSRYSEWQAYLRDRQPPTLIVWGRNDGFFPPAGAEAYLADLPDAELHLLDAGHFAASEHPDEVARLVRDFLDARVGTTA